MSIRDESADSEDETAANAAVSSLAPDSPRLLIGPLHNPVVLGDYARHPQIKLFMPRSNFTEQYPYDLVYPLERVRHFNDILTYLPDGWQPELLIWWDPTFQIMPPGIEDCPYPTALVPADWNLAFNSVFQTARHFDLVIADGRLAPILRKTGFSRVIQWSAFGFDHRQFRRDDDVEPKYDVTFIGNLHPGIHPIRPRYLSQLLRLQDRYRICVRYGVWGDAHRLALAQSRIVFNYTICQVMNMRAYEAPACGALLFIEDTNLEVREILEDRVSCVLYNEANLLELLAYYLEHEDERQAVAEAGYRAIQRHSYEAHFGQLLRQIADLLPLEKGPRSHQQPEERRFIHAVNQIAGSGYAQAHLAQPHLQRLWREFSQFTAERLWELNALLVMCFPHIDEQGQLHSVYRIPLQELRQGFEAAVRLEPEHPVLCYHLAFCCDFGGDLAQALLWYSRALELLAQAPAGVLTACRGFILPFNQAGRGREPLAFEWERASYEALERDASAEAAYARLLGAAIWERLGEILTRQEQYEKAWTAYENSQSLSPRGALLLKMCRLLPVLGRSEQMLPLLGEMLTLQPLLARHLNALISPRLLLAQPAQCADWARHFRPFCQELRQLELLSGLALAAQGRQQPPAPSELGELPQSSYPQLCQVLQSCEAAPALRPLQALRGHWLLRWNLPGEQVPEFRPEDGVVWSEQGLSLGGDGHADFVRVYDQPSALAAGRCGPDLFPFVYPSALTQADAVVLDDMLPAKIRLLLVVLEGWTVARLTELLETFEQLCHDRPEFALLAWCPPGCAFSLGAFEQSMPAEMRAQLIWLDETLTLRQQGALLQRAERVLSIPKGRGLYYSTWAAQLGRAVCWLEAPDWLPAQGVVELPLGDPASVVKEMTQNQPPLPLAFSPLTQEQVRQRWVEALWQLRLQTLHSDQQLN